MALLSSDQRGGNLGDIVAMARARARTHPRSRHYGARMLCVKVDIWGVGGWGGTVCLHLVSLSVSRSRAQVAVHVARSGSLAWRSSGSDGTTIIVRRMLPSRERRLDPQ